MTRIGGVSPQDYQAQLFAQQGFQSRYIPGSMVDTSLLQAQPIHPVQHQESPGFFSKVGATLKGLLNVPETVGRAVLNPRNLLIGAATVGACFIPGVGPFIAGGLIAYGLGSSAVGVARGIGNTAQGWANGDLQQIEQGATQAGVSAATGAASVFGARAFVRSQFAANPATLAKGGQGPVTVGNRTITDATQIGFRDSVRLLPRQLGNVTRGAYGDARAFMRDGSSLANKAEYLGESARLRLAGGVENARAFKGNVDIQTALRKGQLPTGGGGAQPGHLADTLRNIPGQVRQTARNAYDFVVKDGSSLANKAEYLTESARLRLQNPGAQVNEFARRLNNTRAADYAYTYNRDYPGVLPGIAGNLDT